MKTRVISAIIALILLFAVLFSGKLVFAISIFALTVVATHEFIEAGAAGGLRAFKPILYLSALFVLFAGLKGVLFDFNNNPIVILLIVYIICAAALSKLVYKHESVRIEDAGFTFLTVFYVIFMFTFLPLIRNMENGIYLIGIVFIGAWGTDTFAYFAGVNFGKHKMLPKVSPKKSYEGFFGGIAGCVILTIIYGYFLTSKGIVSFSIYNFVFLGLLNGVLSQLGDWIASAIKRYVGIKDYGKIMPGHGGVLDRFDSLIFISPLVYLYLTLLLPV